MARNNRLLSITILLGLLIQFGCNSEIPTTKDVIGTWVSENGSAIFEFNENGTFKAKQIPGEHFGYSEDAVWEDFDGSGNWSLTEGQQFEKIEIEFKERNDLKGLYSCSILISGSNTFENKPPWYLFVWEYNDMDVGDRYKFFKQEEK